MAYSSFLAGGFELLKELKRRTAIRSNVKWAIRQIRKTRFGIEVFRNRYLDLKYGGDCSGTTLSRHSDLGANNVQSSYYAILSSIFSKIPITEADVLVDVGCGKGRVINYWLSLGCRNRMIGIELDEEVALEASSRLKPYPNVTIISGNALDNIPHNGTIFYLFNPFGAHIWEQFKRRLIDLFGEKRNIVLICTNCVHIDVFENDPRWKVQHLARLSSGPAAIVRMANAE